MIVGNVAIVTIVRRMGEERRWFAGLLWKERSCEGSRIERELVSFYEASFDVDGKQPLWAYVNIVESYRKVKVKRFYVFF